MSAQFDNGFSGYTQQFAAAAQRANRMALENAESVFGVQLKTLEKNANATAGFFSELAQGAATEGYQALLPKGLQIARENMERLAAANQELVGLSLKAGEAFSELARAPFTAATTNTPGRKTR